MNRNEIVWKLRSWYADLDFQVWKLGRWLHRCPECGHRPDGHEDGSMPRWEDDLVAKTLGVAQYGCRRCGNGAIEERDQQL